MTTLKDLIRDKISENINEVAIITCDEETLTEEIFLVIKEYLEKVL